MVQPERSAVEVTATKCECGKSTLLQQTTAHVGPQSTTEYNTPYYGFFAEHYPRK